MDASTNGRAPAPHEDRLPEGWRWTVPRALGVAAFLAMALFWIWAFANTGSIPHRDEFDDPVFVEAAEAICTKYQAAIAELPLATAAKNPKDRSELVTLGTVELERMVAELGRLEPPTDPEGATGVDRWLEDYELYFSDRRRYADVLATGEDPAFLISGNSDGVRVTDILTTFADVNRMPSCAPSGDV